MATNRKKNSAPPRRQLSMSLPFNDERFPKIVGLLCLLVSLYLLVAFTSYIFTWHHDADIVNRFYWGLLFQDEQATNWLGRLGAIVSHQFIYWLFGLPSFVLIFIFFITGVSLIREIPISRFNRIFRYCAFILVWGSVLLSFFFAWSSFPWGGAIGDAIRDWLWDFLGPLGVLLFLSTSLLALIIWTKNPDFKGLTFEKIKFYVVDFFQFKGMFQNVRFLHRAEQEEEEEEEEEEEDTRPVPARTRRQTTPPVTNTVNTDITEPVDDIPETPQADLLDLTNRARGLSGNQLSFDVEDNDGRMNRRPPQPQINISAEDEMEIVEPVREVYDDEDEPIGAVTRLPDAPFSDQLANVSEESDGWEGMEPYDPTLELSAYENPVLALLEAYDDQQVVIDRAELEQNKDQIVNTLLNYKIEITKIKATIGPTVTLYEIVPAPGVRISKIKNLEDDIALSLAALGIRIIAPIPGKGTIGIEVPNRNKQIVSLKEVLASEKFKRAKMDLPVALGKTIANEVFVVDLTKMPHLLVAGATGQGKSVGINVILNCMLYKKHPSQVKLVLIDPKKVELSPYNKIDHHYLAYLPTEEEPIIVDTTKVVQTLHSLTIEMDERYNLLKKANVRNITEYNEKFMRRRLNPNKGHKYLPFIVLIVDEFADLIMTAGKEVELPIARLAQLARAIGIHLIIATQRPSVNIITGVIKANFPARLAFKVTSKIDSRTILDAGGAEQLIGRGDMLLSVNGDIVRLQCPFVDTPEVERVIDFISAQRGYPEPFYLPYYGGADGEGGDFDMQTKKVVDELDEFFEDSARLVVIHQSGSTSMIQRRLKLGYNRAGRIMDQLNALGIVGAADGSKPREVLFTDEVELEKYLKTLRDKYGSK